MLTLKLKVCGVVLMLILKIDTTMFINECVELFGSKEVRVILS